MEGEAAWRTAWWPPHPNPLPGGEGVEPHPGPLPGGEAYKDENGVPKKVLAILDQWERDIGMRVNLSTGEVERLPTPGSAYAGDPKIAERCK
ncbi:MAG: hypothetical protein HY719_10460 [Planctomycetes bacterium]|nr:hypothetical protein [Planctomycetota bacterium]